MEKIVSFAACCLVMLLGYPRVVAQNSDIKWLRAIHVDRNTSFDGTMNAISASSYPLSLALPAGQLFIGYVLKKDNAKTNGWQSAAALAATTTITYGLKYAVNRERPYIAYPDIQPYHYDTDGSLPSGHTSIAFSTATSLSLQYPEWYVIAPAYLWAGTVGYARLHLGMHYPSDVLIGAAIGAGSAYLSYKGRQWLQKRKRKTVKPLE